MKMRCRKCKSTMTYIRISTGERVCRHCGDVEKIKGLGTKKKKGAADV